MSFRRRKRRIEGARGEGTRVLGKCRSDPPGGATLRTRRKSMEAGNVV